MLSHGFIECSYLEDVVLDVADLYVFAGLSTVRTVQRQQSFEPDLRANSCVKIKSTAETRVTR